MNIKRQLPLIAFVIVLAALTGAGLAQEAGKAKAPFEPQSGQPGKDVVWVPTPQSVVEKMLDVAMVTPDDFVIDLGSGDGRMVIAAAKRGARALGVEYEDKMVELSRFNAEQAGVAGKALFVQGDMYAADISQASVLALFLLTGNLNKLAPKFLALKPGTRIVLNTFRVDGWEPDETTYAEAPCASWCTVLLHYVPARVEGRWRLAGGGELALEQEFQKVKGTLASGGANKEVEGRLRGADITLTIDGVEYAGRVDGNAMAGETKGGAAGKWSAERM